MTKKPFFRSVWFWSVSVLLAVASVVFLINNFEKANPIVNISVGMDRDEALSEAAGLAEKLNIGPEGYRQAASFRNDTEFQNYTELEGGGLEKFNQVISDGIYHSYQWYVRHFKENEVNEVTFFFTPDGEPYGFFETLSEDLFLPVIPADSAQTLAARAAKDWGVDLAEYELVEKSTIDNPSGRVDHKFSFERKENPVGESKFRFTVEVDGNRLTRVEHHIKIPDDFERRYSEMRSQNMVVSSIGQVFLFIVYGLVGIGLSLFLLAKKRFILWRKALWWAIGIGLATGLIYTMNIMPLLWFNYDTTTSGANFVTRQLFNGLLNSLLMGSIIFLSAVAAEGMGRYLFNNQLQFWKVWGKDAGASKQVLGQTLGAYLFVPVFLAVDVLYYLITTKYLGWWNPAGTLSDPDVLAEALPWYSSIAISLQAGFWEEIMCRAIPLAGVYFLVRNKKSKNFWILITLFAQAIIFGMLHANYPQSPSYARVFEMVIPFVLFGLVYLRFGLLPVIIAHYAVDVFWISLPIFVAGSEGIWLSRLIIILFLLLPLWVVLYWRLKNKKWNEAPESALNMGFEPKPISEAEKKEEVEEFVSGNRKPRLKMKWLLPAALAGLIGWLLLAFPYGFDSPKVGIGKTEAIEISEKLLAEKFDFDPTGWKVLVDIRSTPSKQHRFVWLTEKNKYDQLQHTFLNPPYWLVRYVKTDAGPGERAEEYFVKSGIDGKLIEYKHIWPEKREGESLTEAEAAKLALDALAVFTGNEIAHLDTVAVTPDKLDSRTDWLFEFSDTINYSLNEGQGRFKAGISGNEVSSISQFVFVPEEWERDFDKSQSQVKILTLVSNLVFFLVLILGVVLGFVNWSKKRFSMKLFLFFAVGYFLVSALGILNSIDSLFAGYVTMLPFGNFMIMALIGTIVGLLFLSMGIGVFGGFSCQLAANDIQEKQSLIKAVLGGFFLAGLLAVIEKVSPYLSPRWPNLENLNAYLPFFEPVANNFFALIYKPAFAMVTFFLANQISKNFTKRRVLAVFLVVVFGFLSIGMDAFSINGWLIAGLIHSIVLCMLYLIFRTNVALLPVIYVVPFLLSVIRYTITGIYPNVFLNMLPLLIFGCIIAFFWFWGIRQCSKK
ncbi:MAG: CPBP family intramembrane metalloprotease [Prolixibacteraceae bacterium]|nr:CPBP family intramembrane metalloprotease [Prolixibacteraceae bacterium]